jgi:hypothetical protein
MAMEKKEEILIIHFRAAMDYPPVYNLARYLALKGVAVKLLTGKRKESSKGLENYGVKVIEVGMDKGSSVGNYVGYLFFYARALVEMMKTPKVPLIYFESISSIPVVLYFRLFPFATRSLAIHYHEYFDKEEHQRQSFLERLGRKLEPVLFKRARWISHTNQDRLNFFSEEFKGIEKTTLRTMPNYPPASWLSDVHAKHERDNTKVKLVYVGSVSLEKLFLKELVEWLRLHNGNVVCDVYTKYMDANVLRYIQSHPSEVICYKGSLQYDQLPEVLSQYDVGLVLYNGIASSNFVYNAPNKLFEYLACGLDVWFSSTLLSSYVYQTKDTYPKVIKVDFANLAEFDYKMALQKEGLSYKKSPFVMESVYEVLYKIVIAKS